MAVTIKHCPHCRTMLFDDTVQCPDCKHILDPARHEEMAAPASTSVNEKACPQCGETVRTGLVRCWNCSAFMKDEMAEVYREMQESPQPVIYSLLPDDAELRMVSDGDAEDDFELGSAAPTHRLIAETETPTPSPDEAGEDAGANEAPPEPDVAHSVATGGDVLLQVARAQELEERHRRKQRQVNRRAQPRSATGMLLFCPNGHRIEVDQRYRGMTGRCPKCKSPFIVPVAVESESETEAVETETTSTGFGKYARWMSNVHVHSLNPERFKLKAGSLKNDFQLYDFAFATGEILAAALTKRKGTAANVKSKKLQQDREALQDALRKSVSISDASTVDHFTYAGDQAGSIAVVQPAADVHQSMFAGIPVFGEGRSAVRLPAGEDPGDVRFASFTLSEFREFAQVLNDVYGIEALGEVEGVPLTDSFGEGQCHYSEQKLSFLENAQYHKADPDIELQLVGRKCQACGLIVSEDMRKKEKIGGANGKAIAKAKCPKCQQKFGDISLFSIEQPPQPTTEGETEAAEEVVGAEA